MSAARLQSMCSIVDDYGLSIKGPILPISTTKQRIFHLAALAVTQAPVLAVKSKKLLAVTGD